MTKEIAGYLLERLFLKIAGQSWIMRSIKMILTVSESIGIKHRNTSLQIGFSADGGIVVATNHEFTTIHAIEQSKPLFELISSAKHKVAADNECIFRRYTLIILFYDSFVHLFNALKTTSFPDELFIVIIMII